MTTFDGVKDSGERRAFDTGSVRDVRTGKGRFDLIPPEGILRLAQHFENGAVKYGDRNWQLGQPLSSYIDSGLRHGYNLLALKVDEDHPSAAIWNFMAFLCTAEWIIEGKLPRELDDIGYCDALEESRENDELEQLAPSGNHDHTASMLTAPAEAPMAVVTEAGEERVQTTVLSDAGVPDDRNDIFVGQEEPDGFKIFAGLDEIPEHPAVAALRRNGYTAWQRDRLQQWAVDILGTVEAPTFKIPSSISVEVPEVTIDTLRSAIGMVNPSFDAVVASSRDGYDVIVADVRARSGFNVGSIGSLGGIEIQVVDDDDPILQATGASWALVSRELFAETRPAAAAALQEALDRDQHPENAWPHQPAASGPEGPGYPADWPS